MSSILKALRKIEDEKRADKHAAPDLMSDQGLAPVRPKRVKPLLAGVVLGAMIVGGVFLWSSREGATVSESQPVILPMRDVAVSSSAQGGGDASNIAPVVGPASSNESLPTIVPSERSLKELAEASRVSVVTLPPQPVTTAGSSNAAALKPATKPATQPAVTSPAKPEVMPVEVMQNLSAAAVKADKSENTLQVMPPVVKVAIARKISAGLPGDVSLQVTEIFFQDDSVNSMAVVNDLPVMVGTQIDSAVVVEIRPDAVFFEIDSATYEVRQSNP